MKKIIFFTVFLYLIGFGIIIPILPLLGEELGGNATQVGLLMSIFSLMQFVFAPMWGFFSDKHGRRPILVGCLLGEALTYIWFAFSRDYYSLFFARLLAGFFGASLSTASAYISDITPPEERSKGMAIIGAAFGLGFVIGPALGGALIQLGHVLYPDTPIMGSTIASLFVSILCFITFIFAYFKLPESLPIEKRNNSHDNKLFSKDKNKPNRILLVFSKLKIPVLNTLIISFFCNTFAMASMEATLVLYVGKKFGWTFEKVSYGFAYIGIIMIITQGFLVRRFISKIGERLMASMGLSLFSLGMLLIALANSIEFLAVAMTFLALGNGLSNPSLMGSISLASPSTEQGVNLGVTQSISALGRIVGPIFGSLLYQNVSEPSPFLFAAILGGIGLAIIFFNFSKLPNSALKKNYNT